MAFDVVYYINFGYPDIEASAAMVRRYITLGARKLQLDLPSKNPFKEIDLVKERMSASLSVCDDMGGYMDAISEIKREYPQVDIQMMVYEDSVEAAGLCRFVEFCRCNAIKYVSYVGAESAQVTEVLKKEGIERNCYVSWRVTDLELEKAKGSRGIVLVQAQNGTSGSVGARPECGSLAARISFLRANGVSAPIYATMGIRRPEDLAAARASGADSAYIGSSLMSLWNDDEAFERLMRQYQAVVGR